MESTSTMKIKNGHLWIKSVINIFGSGYNLHIFVRVGKKSPYTHTIYIKIQFQFTQHSTHYNVKWQFGYSIKDNAYMVAIARDFSDIVGMADTSSHSVKEWLVAFKIITPQMLQHMSQGTWRHIHLCIQHQGAHTDSLDM
jgi:hypothetical protein